MKRLVFLLMTMMMMLTGCASENDSNDNYPYIKYQHNVWTYDNYNKIVEIQNGYILDQGHSYDIIKTEEGYDVIFHIIKELE